MFQLLIQFVNLVESAACGHDGTHDTCLHDGGLVDSQYPLDTQIECHSTFDNGIPRFGGGE